jgi:hypothetical protein
MDVGAGGSGVDVNDSGLCRGDEPLGGPEAGVKMAAESPYSTAFARANASSRVVKRNSEATGPNVSWRARAAWSSRSSKRVGATK